MAMDDYTGSYLGVKRKQRGSDLSFLKEFLHHLYQLAVTDKGSIAGGTRRYRLERLDTCEIVITELHHNDFAMKHAKNLSKDHGTPVKVWRHENGDWKFLAIVDERQT
jgi:hypothetical protein